MMKNTIKSPCPAANVHRHEAVATDAVYASVPAVDSGVLPLPVFYIGRESLVKTAFPMKTDKQFVNTEDIIRKYGAWTSYQRQCKGRNQCPR
jgi:hypothetical protein